MKRRMHLPGSRREAWPWPTGLAMALVALFLAEPVDGRGAFDGPGPFTIPASAFQYDGTPTGAYYYSFTGYFYNPGSFSSCFYAPAYLPDGYELRVLKLFAGDFSASNFTLMLTRSDHGGVSTDTMATVSTSGDGGQMAVQTTVDAFPVISNASFNYRVQACLPAAGTQLRIYSVQFLDDPISADGFESVMPP